MIYAANILGLEGKTIQEEWYTKAANAGTLGHDLFEAHILGNDRPDTSEYEQEEIDKANTALGAAVRWWNMTDVELIWTEHPLVSEKLQLGGTPDALGKTPGLGEMEADIFDWKTGGVYGSALFQVATYKILVEETSDYKVKGFHIVRFAKDTGDFVHRYYPELDMQVKAIPYMRRLYDVIKDTDKRAR